MKVWLKKESNKSYSCLTNEAMAVIGLLSMGIEDLDEIAGLLLGSGTHKGKRRFAEIVASSRNQVIVKAKICPPHDMAGRLSGAVRCPLCGEKVFFVPCRFCSSISFRECYTDEEVDECTPTQPTRFLPGTPGKLMVLASRAELGESLFHPQDGAWPVPVVGGRMRNPETLLTRCQEIDEGLWCSEDAGPEEEELEAIAGRRPAEEFKDESQQRKTAGIAVQGGSGVVQER